MLWGQAFAASGFFKLGLVAVCASYSLAEPSLAPASVHWGAMSTVSRSASRKGRQSSGASEGKTIADAARDAAVNSKVTVSTAAVATELPAMTSVPEHAKQSPASQIVSAAALLGICIMSFSLRLFSVIKYESVIHEFDPYFNYRVTSFLTKYGFSDTWNWFDDRTWYPLGRVIGGTMYPVSFGHTCFALASWSKGCVEHPHTCSAS